MNYRVPPFVNWENKATSVPIRLGVLEEMKRRLSLLKGEKVKQIDFVSNAVTAAIKRKKLPVK